MPVPSMTVSSKTSSSSAAPPSSTRAWATYATNGALMVLAEEKAASALQPRPRWEAKSYTTKPALQPALRNASSAAATAGTSDGSTARWAPEASKRLTSAVPDAPSSTAGATAPAAGADADAVSDGWAASSATATGRSGAASATSSDATGSSGRSAAAPIPIATPKKATTPTSASAAAFDHVGRCLIRRRSRRMPEPFPIASPFRILSAATPAALRTRAFRDGFSAVFPTEYSVTAGQRQDDATEQHNSATVCSHGLPEGKRGLNACHHQRFRSLAKALPREGGPSWPAPAPPCHGRRQRLRGSIGGTMPPPALRKGIT